MKPSKGDGFMGVGTQIIATGVIGSIGALTLDSILSKGYSLKKENTMRIKRILQPNMKFDVPLSYDALNNCEGKEFLIEAIDKLEKAFAGRNLVYFHNNIKNLKFKTKLSKIDKFFDKSMIGSYNPVKNIIQIDPSNTSRALSHELLHLASTTKDFSRVYTGFAQRRNIAYFGYGLNEGYTELLNNRYFLDKKSTIYYAEQLYAQGIEKLVGRQQMEYYYFIGELSYLYQDLKKYYSDEEIQKLIVSLDIINDYSYNDKRTKRQDRLLKKSFKISYLLIYKGLLKKLEEAEYVLHEVNDFYFLINEIKEITELYDVDINEDIPPEWPNVYRKILEIKCK